MTPNHVRYEPSYTTERGEVGDELRYATGCTAEGGEAGDELRYATDASLGEAIHGDEEGSATVAIVGIIVALLIIATFVVAASSVYAHRSQLQGVADMAALAGADATPISLIMAGGAAPTGCATSQAVAELNGVQLDTCDVDTLGDIRVKVSRPATLLGFAVTVQAKACAGPARPHEGLGTGLRPLLGGGVDVTG
ncbi:Rv3654c family TadE-like protein [Actinomycetaceae bacterium MB13-C1-2]|nr:Rv3654c family TadE-like protein [Actinomycetaceae bacterium MB13-C1-2]